MDYYSIGWRDNADGQGQAYHDATDREDNNPMNTQQAKHTPGPWHMHVDSVRYPYVVQNAASQCIAETGQNVYIDPAVHEANARLIASAPQLLEALQACLCALTDETGNVARREADACLQARAAIQSATTNP